jgi:hypothetical protein
MVTTRVLRDTPRDHTIADLKNSTDPTLQRRREDRSPDWRYRAVFKKFPDPEAQGEPENSKSEEKE